MPQPHDFLDAAGQHRGEWWRYLLVFLGIQYYWWRLSGTVAAWCQSTFSQLFNSADIGLITAILAPQIVVVMLLWIALKGIHHRPFRSLINRDARIHWQRLGLGFGVWLLLVVVLTAFDIWVNPESYAFTFEPRAWFSTLPFILLLTPIQTSAEEFLYRGYFIQGVGLISKQPMVLILASSIIFALPHFGNAEMQRGFIWGAVVYLLWGIFFATITLKDNGLELALGVHAANNLFDSLCLQFADSSLPIPAIWTYVTSLTAEEGLVSLIILTTIFYFIFFGGLSRRSRSSSSHLQSSIDPTHDP